MRMTWIPRALAGLAIVGLFALSAGPSHAELGVGEEAPPVEGKEFFNTESITYAELRGRLIFLELFATW
ncbi:MAG: hypothetical protein QNJ98_07830 [Planctomycetota bacterium]|nr:hypothetical protein [Planctomycetota bacterium]